MSAAIITIAPMIGCTAQTLLVWVKCDEVDHGMRNGVGIHEREPIKSLERQVKDRANENLKVASTFFAKVETEIFRRPAEHFG